MCKDHWEQFKADTPPCPVGGISELSKPELKPRLRSKVFFAFPRPAELRYPKLSLGYPFGIRKPLPTGK